MLISIEFGIERALFAFGGLNIENGSRLLAFGAFGAIIEREIKWTVSYIVVQSATLIILFDDVIDRLLA